MAWTTTELIASIKRRTGMPVAQATYTTAEILAIANEELQSYVVPKVLDAREDYYTATYDVSLVDGQQAYRIPGRAVGGKLREVYTITTSGNLEDIPRLQTADLDEPEFGFWIQGDSLYLASGRGLGLQVYGPTLRMIFTLRPATMVDTGSATTVQSFNRNARTITLAGTPTGYSSATSWDVVKAKPGFETLAFDAAGTIVGSTITFALDLPQDLEVGDYVCLTEQAPVPQIPVELHPLLAQRAALAILEAKQMDDKAVIASQKLKEMEANAAALLTPRVDGEAVRFVDRTSPFRVRW